MQDVTVVEKILRSLTEKFNYFVQLKSLKILRN